MITITDILNVAFLRWRNYTVSTGAAPNTAVSLKRADAPATTIVANNNGDFPILTLAGHRLRVGDFVVLSSATAGYEMLNGRWKVTSVPNANTFSVGKIKGSNSLAAGAVTVTVSFPVQAQRAYVIADAANTAPVTIGTDPTCDLFSLAAGQEYTFEAPPGAKFDIADLWAKSANANQNVRVQFL
jgi:hypothetical protein